MAFRNKYDKDGSAFDAGESAESSFVKACEADGVFATKATRSQEFRHIDFILSTGKSVDVKARKKVKRKDLDVNDEILWVEFANVQGKRGWIYGDAHLIAFEREKDFVIVERPAFASLCERLCDLSKLNINTSFPLYTGYQRRGRADLLSLIKFEDVLNNLKCGFLNK